MHHRPLFRALCLGVLGLTGILAAACSAAPDEATGAQTADNTEGHYVQDNEPYWWTESTYDELRSVQEGFRGTPMENAIADDHPLTQRAQAWLDRIDEVVRERYQEEHGEALVAPKPIAKVLVSSSTYNAWVSPMGVCLNTPYGNGQDTGLLPILTDTGVAAVHSLPSCVRTPSWQPKDVVRFLNAGTASCSLALDASGLMSTKGSTCQVDPSLTGSTEFGFLATSRYIHFSTDLLATMSEPELALVAAHELGHYYLGHTTSSPRSTYGFWYTRDGVSAKTPMPAKDAEVLKAAYLEIEKGRTSLGGNAFASKYSARIRNFLVVGLGPLLIERAEPGFACAAARDAFAAGWGQTTGWVTALQSETPSEAARNAFADYETKLSKCAAKISLDADPGADTLSAGQVLFAASQYRPADRAKISLRPGDDLGAFIARLDTQAKDFDAKAAKLVERARSNGIGLYTDEQQADEFALEITVKMGFSVDQMLAAWVEFMHANEATLVKSYGPEFVPTYYAQTGEKTADECEALLQNGFTGTNASGARVPVTMSLGDLSDSHHTGCYRLFNLYAEAKVHGYAPTTAPPEALSPPWEELRAQAETLANGGSPQ